VPCVCGVSDARGSTASLRPARSAAAAATGTARARRTQHHLPQDGPGEARGPRTYRRQTEPAPEPAADRRRTRTEEHSSSYVAALFALLQPKSLLLY